MGKEKEIIMIDKYLLLARSNINEYVKKAIFDVYQNNIEDGLKILNKIATYVPSIQDIKTEGNFLCLPSV